MDPEAADAMMQVLVLGPSKSGKTFLLNQVLAEKRDDGTCRAGVGRRDARGRDSALYPREREARRSNSERERGHATTTLR